MCDGKRLNMILISWFLGIGFLTNPSITSAQEVGPSDSGQEVLAIESPEVHVTEIRQDIPSELTLKPYELSGKRGTYTTRTELTPEETAVLAQLSPEELARFEKKRIQVLQKVYRVLQSSKFMFGFGSFIKNQIKMVVPKKWRNSSASLGYSEYSNQSILSIMNSLDSNLIKDAKVVASSNEIGFSLSLGLSAGGMLGKKGFLGSSSLGFSFGFNSKTKAFVFEIFNNTERGTKAFPFVATASVSGNATVRISSSDSQNNTSLFTRGRAIYPPGPVVFSDTPTSLQTGLSHGLGLVPIDLFFAYETQTYRTTILRVELSSIYRGFLNVNFIGQSTIVSVMKKIKEFNKFIQREVNTFSSNIACGRLFL